MRERFPFVGRVYATAEDLLADPEVRYVDLATGPEGRLDWIEAAVDAGKHVLAQKPLTLSADDLARLPALLDRGRGGGRPGRREPQRALGPAVARGDPAGARGRDRADVVGVTHLHDKPLPPLAGTPFDDVPHMLLTDYLLHWVDITRSWLQDGGAGPVTTVQATDSRVPGQPDEARNPWSATLSMATASGATATLRIAGNVVASEPGLPVLGARHHRHPARQRAARTPTGSSSTTAPRRTSVPLHGAWFVDGFAAAMGELMCAVAEDRRARELRGRRGALGRAGARRRAPRPSGAASRSTRARCGS